MRSSSFLLACVLQSAVGFQAGVHMAAQRPAIRATTSTMVMPEPATIEAASQLLAAKSQADELLGDAMALVFPAGTALAVAVRSAGLQCLSHEALLQPCIPSWRASC